MTRFRWSRLLPALVFTIAITSQAETDWKIYSDGLTNAFEDRGWTARDFANTEPVHSGKLSIRVTPTEWWQGISIYHAEFDTTPYASLSFWVHGGAEGGQRIEVKGLLANARPVTNAYHRFNAATNAWEKITIPLASIGIADITNCSGFWVQLTPNGASNTFYLDDIQLNAKPVVQAAAAPLSSHANESNMNPAWWIAGVLTVLTVLLGWLVLMLRKSGLGKPDVLTHTPSTTALARRDDAGTEDWKQRALAAEAMAGKQAQVLTEKVIPELTEFAKQSLVQGLYSQRNALIETQQKAQRELAALEERLVSLQLPFQDRVRAYEKRITELERELDTRGEEMRELTKATLLLMRQKLEQEKQREQERTRFN